MIRYIHAMFMTKTCHVTDKTQIRLSRRLHHVWKLKRVKKHLLPKKKKITSLCDKNDNKLFVICLYGVSAVHHIMTILIQL